MLRDDSLLGSEKGGRSHVAPKHGYLHPRTLLQSHTQRASRCAEPSRRVAWLAEPVRTGNRPPPTGTGADVSLSAGLEVKASTSSRANTTEPRRIRILRRVVECFSLCVISFAGSLRELAAFPWIVDSRHSALPTAKDWIGVAVCWG